MALYSISNPFMQILNKGTGLNDGAVYFGEPNQDPEIFPKDVYWDLAGTDIAAQPIPTSGGYLWRMASPAAVYTEGTYSIRVRDKQGNEVYYEAEVNDAVQQFLEDVLGPNGAGLIGFSQSETYPSATLGKKSQQFLNPLDAPWSAVGNGTTDDRAALAAADAAAVALGAPLFITKRHRVSSNLTIQSDIYFIGGDLRPDNSVTITCRGVVNGPSSRIFAGNGAVVGIRKVQPEWFGAVRDGATDDSDALNACNTCIMQSATSRGPGRPEIVYGSGTYGLAKTHRITPTITINTKASGAGGVFGTRFRTLSSWSNSNGVMAFHIDGQTRGSSDATTDFEVRDFSLDRAVGSTCQVGIWAGGAMGGGKEIRGLQTSLIENVSSNDFPVAWQANDIRQVTFRRCSAWIENTAGAVGFKLSAIDTNSFTGDIDFENCQVSGAVVNAGSNVFIDSTGVGQVRGLRFKSLVSYRGKIHVNIAQASTRDCGDIWFDSGCQFDGVGGTVFNLTCASGCTLDAFWADGVYARGIQSGDAFLISINSGGQISGLQVVGCDIKEATTGALPVISLQGAHVNVAVTGNSFTDCSSTKSLVVVSGASDLVQVARNRAFKRGSGTAVGMVEFSATSNGYTAEDNVGSVGMWTGSVVIENNGAPSRAYVPATSNR